MYLDVEVRFSSKSWKSEYNQSSKMFTMNPKYVKHWFKIIQKPSKVTFESTDIISDHEALVPRARGVTAALSWDLLGNFSKVYHNWINAAWCERFFLLFSILSKCENEPKKKFFVHFLQWEIMNIPPIVQKGLLKGTQVCKRDFSKGFQVRESKGGNKVRFLTITQKGGIQRRNPRFFFLVRGFLGRIKIW